MSAILRLMGWAWLMAGLLGLGTVIIHRMGSVVPVPMELAPSLSVPWSWLLPMMSLTPTLELVVMGVGIFINAQILFVIANLLGD